MKIRELLFKRTVAVWRIGEREGADFLADCTNVDQPLCVLTRFYYISRFHSVKISFSNHRPLDPGTFNDRLRNGSRARSFNDP